jgi:N-acetylneuraminic acid mutarotase
MKNMFVIFSVNIWVSLLNQNVAVAQGTWTQKADFPGEMRYGVASFSIGTKCYIGKGESMDGHLLKDFWEWDQATNIWIRKADFQEIPHYGVTKFSIGDKGYIGTGGNVKNDFWEYDPATDTWNQKEPVPETAGIAYAVGFSIGTKGYIGTGRNIKKNNYTNEFWEWDQETNVWTQKADFGSARLAVVFQLTTKDT